ncbi:hypothetical protein ACOSQ3_032823 [Xanthoceras sorbifolium]
MQTSPLPTVSPENVTHSPFNPTLVVDLSNQHEVQPFNLHLYGSKISVAAPSHLIQTRSQCFFCYQNFGVCQLFSCQSLGVTILGPNPWL